MLDVYVPKLWILIDLQREHLQYLSIVKANEMMLGVAGM